MSVDAVHVSVQPVAVIAEAARPAGLVGTVASKVFTDKALLSVERLPAASLAWTVKL